MPTISVGSSTVPRQSTAVVSRRFAKLCGAARIIPVSPKWSPLPRERSAIRTSGAIWETARKWVIVPKQLMESGDHGAPGESVPGHVVEESCTPRGTATALRQLMEVDIVLENVKDTECATRRNARRELQASGLSSAPPLIMSLIRVNCSTGHLSRTQQLRAGYIASRTVSSFQSCCGTR